MRAFLAFVSSSSARIFPSCASLAVATACSSAAASTARAALGVARRRLGLLRHVVHLPLQRVRALPQPRPGPVRLRKQLPRRFVRRRDRVPA
ncbi:hypothetical protein GUJ93_ZPchr0001g29717 [Zizania palustris]|uniref:Uncharacterized protein n=1 Tax=Zizania palustris TaxID=103762 RepID=A0A8J5RX98_ZIZPA|nr:hypothetical protein GUJ93_ZPchr0001g29717 [Zizania palustris]